MQQLSSSHMSATGTLRPANISTSFISHDPVIASNMNGELAQSIVNH